MTTPKKEWGPFGMGPWKGHPKVYCSACGWPQYHMWVDREHEPPGTCPDGHTLPRACQRVLDVLMQNAFVVAALGKTEHAAPIEMLRKVTGLTWDEIERMTDASGRGSEKIADMRRVNGQGSEEK